MLAELLLYNASIPIERMFGSAKFAVSRTTICYLLGRSVRIDVELLPCVLCRMKSFSVASVITATLLEFAGLLSFNRLGFNVIPAGPTALVFSILYQFAKLVPNAYTFRIFGVTLTNKIFLYILAFQVINTLTGSK